jgi:hypothetical protein
MNELIERRNVSNSTPSLGSYLDAFAGRAKSLVFQSNLMPLLGCIGDRETEMNLDVTPLHDLGVPWVNVQDS